MVRFKPMLGGPRQNILPFAADAWIESGRLSNLEGEALINHVLNGLKRTRRAVRGLREIKIPRQTERVR